MLGLEKERKQKKNGRKLKIIERNNASMTSPKTRVVVIGGGLAGIYAARTLHELTGDAKRVNVEVILVEAQDTLGGRIQPIPDHHFRSLPPGKRLEIGAEFLHGDGSLFNHYAESVLKMDTRLAFDFEVLSTGKSRHQQSFLLHYQGCMHAPGDHHDLVQLNNALELLSEPYEVQRQNKVLERILDSEGDISVGQYLREMGIPERTMGIADALFSKTAGTSLDVNGLKDTVLEQQQWVYGSRNYQFYRDYSRSLVHYLAQDLPGVRLNWPVQSVEYGAKGNITVRRKGSHDVIDNVDFVIVAVPLSILRNRDISFTPELPPYKQQAIQCLEMHGGIKTICMFKHQFWKPKFSNLRLIIIGDDPIYSQCWMPAVQERSDWKERPAVVTGFLTGDKANEITERMKRGEIDEQWMIERFMEVCIEYGIALRMSMMLTLSSLTCPTYYIVSR